LANLSKRLPIIKLNKENIMQDKNVMDRLNNPPTIDGRNK